MIRLDLFKFYCIALHKRKVEIVLNSLCDNYAMASNSFVCISARNSLRKKNLEHFLYKMNRIKISQHNPRLIVIIFFAALNYVYFLNADIQIF